ncbi:MAG: anthranilate synthase component I [Verrucomicrobia bacterium]|nr:MAG: anthranilate synthase component I [Verrucomicrobiota bacterium]
MLTLFPDKKEFFANASKLTVAPLWVEFVADFETPISAYRKLAGEEILLLLESAEKHDLMGRYSLLALGAHATISAKGNDVQVVVNGKVTTLQGVKDPLGEVEKFIKQYPSPQRKNLAPFWGGAIGYLGYDCVRWFEPSISAPSQDELGVPDMFFLVPAVVLVFDHRARKLRIIASVFTDKGEQAYDLAAERIHSVVEKLSLPTQLSPLCPAAAHLSITPKSNTSRERYYEMVEQAKEYIRAGDIFQVVLSQRFISDFEGDPLDLYRVLRFVNPSPYMYCLQFPEGFSLVGSSPEVHVRVTGKKVEIRPIAGTRRRGQNKDEETALEADLLADAKERAEHLMLVDLARNDVGRISTFGSVDVSDFMTIERYSHVIHLASHVTGTLKEGSSAFDVMRATFPAGTVSGSPKVRAMQIINELETSKRCTYAGAVGYFGYNGDLDSCITLRTILLKNGKAYIQAGGGVVADSTPEGEYHETINKAMAPLRALEIARNIPK